MNWRFQFHLRTMFVVVTIAAIACRWLAKEACIVQERRETILHLESGICCYTCEPDHPDMLNRPGPSWIRRLLGDVNVCAVFLRDVPMSEARIETIKMTFPEAIVTRDSIAGHVVDGGLRR